MSEYYRRPGEPSPCDGVEKAGRLYQEERVRIDLVAPQVQSSGVSFLQIMAVLSDEAPSELSARLNIPLEAARLAQELSRRLPLLRNLVAAHVHSYIWQQKIQEEYSKLFDDISHLPRKLVSIFERGANTDDIYQGTINGPEFRDYMTKLICNSQNGKIRIEIVELMNRLRELLQSTASTRHRLL